MLQRVLPCGDAHPVHPPPARRSTAVTLLTSVATPVPGHLHAFHTRVVEVVLSPLVSFQMREVLFQRRPNHWARIWPTSLALSRWLLEHLPGDLPAHARELGCGMGLASMTLAHLGVRTQGTDREPAALAFASQNATRNALPGFTVAHLDWSEPSGAPAPLVVASDVLYEPESPLRIFSLLQTAGLLLPRGRLLLGGPRERPAPVRELVARLLDHGYAHTGEVRTVEWQGRTEQIDVHLLVRPA